MNLSRIRSFFRDDVYGKDAESPARPYMVIDVLAGEDCRWAIRTHFSVGLDAVSRRQRQDFGHDKPYLPALEKAVEFGLCDERAELTKLGETVRAEFLAAVGRFIANPYAPKPLVVAERLSEEFDVDLTCEG